MDYVKDEILKGICIKRMVEIGIWMKVNLLVYELNDAT